MIYRLSLLLLLASVGAAEASVYRPGEGPSFGTYTRAYADRQQAKRWRELCKGGGRYQAMGEAYEAGKPDPCNRPALETK
jgi:hypothetical protein